MRARIYTNGGNMTGGFTFNGGVMTGALLLAGNPSEALEAAAKQYVDSSLVNLNATNVSTGILPTARLPSFAGDLVKPAGSSTINLAPTGVTAGDFIKPTIDEKGRVVGGGVLTEADVPNMSWNKVSINRPDTLAEYGITNGVNLSGGVLSGFLTYNGAVTQALQAVNKQYVDITLSNATGISIGDIIRKPYTTTPPGFLKCNGAEVDKITFNTLYSVIGDRFSKNSVFHGGRPWASQYSINDTQVNDISSWINGNNLSIPSHGWKRAIVTKNRVYLLGGYDGSNTTAAVQTALINADGTLGTWGTATSLPYKCLAGNIIVIKNNVYLIGGYIGVDGSGTDMLLTVYKAPINSDGTIGTWVAAGTLPGPTYTASCVVTSTKVYIIGGATSNLAGSQSNKIYSANISSDGSLSAWVTEPNAPFFKAGGMVIQTKNRVYICGGETSLYTSTSVATVYTAAINNDGTLGSWVLATSLPLAFSGGDTYVTKNKAYIFGGGSFSSAISSVIIAPINADGTLGTWTFGTSIPSVRNGVTVIATKNKLHLLGGWNGSTEIATNLVADISGGLNDYSAYYAVDKTNYLMPGAGTPWSNQYQTNTAQSVNLSTWAQVSTFPATISHTHIVVTKNKVFAIGGNIGGSTSSAIYNATINTDGTIGSWSNIGSIPSVVTNGSMIVTKNRVHLLGGWTGSTGLNTVYTAAINADGTLGTWTTGNTLPGTLHYTNAVITKNRVYLFGGHNGSGYVSTVYYAAINSDGTLGTWFTNTVALPNALGEHHAVVTKNRVYLIGGYNGSAYVSTILTAAINPDGSIGTWSTHGSFPVTIGAHISFVTKNTIYVMGGYQAGGYPTNVYYAPINADGVIGAWSTGSANVFGGAHIRMFATSTRLYAVGGHNGAATNIVQAALINGITNDYSSYYDGSITSAAAVEDINFMMPGSGRPWNQQYQINTLQNTDITGWNASANLPTTLGEIQVFATKNRIYLVGGKTNATTSTSNVYTATVNTDGTLGTWTSAGNVPTPLFQASVFLTKNRVYLCGGYNGSAYTSTVYYAAINADGTIGSWVTGAALPAAIGEAEPVVTNNRVYLLGGCNSGGTTVSTVYTAQINTDGSLGAWSTTTSLPGAASHSIAFATKNRVYLAVGFNGGSYVTTVYTAPINADGTLGTWSTAGNTLGGMTNGSVFVTANTVYILGGYNGSYVSTVQRANIDADGVIGSWVAGTALPIAVNTAGCVAVNGKIYMIGGFTTGPNAVSSVYYATIAGTIQDYSPYYDGSVVPNNANVIMSSTFALPDLTQDEKFDTTSYIKY